jgi:TRAP-type C4-dicarboxylate transport system permease small subunit
MNNPEASEPAGRAGALETIDRLFGRLNHTLGVIVAISIGLFALSISGDLAMRRLGLGNLPWLYEMIEYVLYGGVFLAAPWVLREGAHVRVDLLLSALPRKAALNLERVLDVMGAAVCAALAFYGWEAGLEAFVSDSRQFKTLIVYDWWLMAIFTVSLGLLAIEFLLRLRRTAGAFADIDDPASKAGF